MRTLTAVFVVLAAMSLSACATQPLGKPVITKRVVRELLANCHASGGDFYRSKKGLPYFSVKSAAGEVASGEKPTATVDCVGRGAQPYRYKYMRLDDATPSED